MSKNINIKLWADYENNAIDRGKLVHFILSKEIEISGAKILDFGSGTGGSAIALAARGAHVTAVDIDVDKLSRLSNTIEKMSLPISLCKNLNNLDEKFDAILLIDVLEHLSFPEQLFNRFYTLLSPNGIIYLSTPNKCSFLNILCDPHYSLPMISILSRNQVKKIVAKFLKWQPESRVDFPELYTINKIDKILGANCFKWEFVNRQVAEFGFQNPNSIWNRALHLNFIKIVKKRGGEKSFLRLITNHVDFFNRYINPTWYIVIKIPDAKKHRV